MLERIKADLRKPPTKRDWVIGCAVFTLIMALLLILLN
jgi:hypothetical protein